MTTNNSQPLHLFNARFLDNSSGKLIPGGILIRNGKIEDFSIDLLKYGKVADAKIHDCKGAIIAPGLVDMRVFLGGSGEENRENMLSASKAAAAGGVTSLLSQPNSSPVLDDPAMVDFVLRRAKDHSLVNILPAAALTKGCNGQEISEIGLLKEAGAIAVSDGYKPIINPQLMRRALTYAKCFDMLVINHVEDQYLASSGVMNEGEFATRLGLPGNPKIAEAIMLERDIRLVELTSARYHAAIITCRESLGILRRAKEAGLPVTAGTSINHLTLNELDIGDYRTFLKLSPPLRGEEDRLALVRAVNEGLIDVIVSDHNPQDVGNKRLPFFEAAYGAIGLETIFAASLRLVEAGEISLSRIIEAMTASPARILGLNVGRIERGSTADIFLFDPEYPWILESANLFSNCKNTPFDGAQFFGKVIMTIVAGNIIFSSNIAD